MKVDLTCFCIGFQILDLLGESGATPKRGRLHAFLKDTQYAGRGAFIFADLYSLAAHVLCLCIFGWCFYMTVLSSHH